MSAHFKAFYEPVEYDDARAGWKYAESKEGLARQFDKWLDEWWAGLGAITIHGCKWKPAGDFGAIEGDHDYMLEVFYSDCERRG